jgi:hypothetical protein
MASAKFISHAGRQIVFLDFANCDVEQTLQVIAEGAKLIRAQPLKSVSILSDFTGASSDPRLLAAMRTFTAGNEPFVLASAIVGLSRVAKIFYEIIVKFTRRVIPIFADTDQAKGWLIAQTGEEYFRAATESKVSETTAS